MELTLRRVARFAFGTSLLALAACSSGGGNGDGCQPTAEVCNGVDDDCDGQTDEDLGLGDACTSGVGACAATGTVVCAVGGGTACSAVPGTPGTEVCNEIDDDCDGTADDGFDTQTDPVNCGACGNACSLPNATAACTGGACTVDSCDAGYVDVDPGVPGCEYACTPTGAEACNGADDDCDGQTDEGCAVVCAQSDAYCEADHRTRRTCNAAGTGFDSEVCSFYCAAATCQLASGLPEGLVAACGPSAPALAPAPGQTVVYRQGTTDPEIVCSVDCGGGTTVVPIPYSSTYGMRSLCLSALEIPAGVVLTHDGSSPPPLIVIVDGSARIEGAIDFDGLDGGGAPGESGRPGGAAGPGGSFGASGCSLASCGGLGGIGPGAGGGGIAGSEYGGGGGGAGHENPGGGGGTGGTDGLGGFSGAAYGSEAVPFFGSGGGSGARGTAATGSGPGGGGGGGIRISAREAISVTGTLSASGGHGGSEVAGSGGGGGGSGGAILLEARVYGATGAVRVDGGNGGGSGTIAGGMGATFLSFAQDGLSSTTGGGGGGGGGTGFLVVRASYLDQDADGIPDGEDTCPTVPGMCFTIGDIRTGLVPEGTSVVLEDVVVTAVDAGGTQQSIWVQDANPAVTENGGIQLFFGAAALPAVSVGDLATVTGVYGEFFGVSQLTSPDATLTASGFGVTPIVVADPADIATGGGLAEPFEGMLVTVENVTVTAAPDASGEFVVTGGLRVDDLIYSAGPVGVGATFSSITGILHFSLDDSKLEPRSAADLVP